jgi:hypothetical protein
LEIELAGRAPADSNDDMIQALAADRPRSAVRQSHSAKVKPLK